MNRGFVLFYTLFEETKFRAALSSNLSSSSPADGAESAVWRFYPKFLSKDPCKLVPLRSVNLFNFNFLLSCGLGESRILSWIDFPGSFRPKILLRYSIFTWDGSFLSLGLYLPPDFRGDIAPFEAGDNLPDSAWSTSSWSGLIILIYWRFCVLISCLVLIRLETTSWSHY